MEYPMKKFLVLSLVLAASAVAAEGKPPTPPPVKQPVAVASSLAEANAAARAAAVNATNVGVKVDNDVKQTTVLANDVKQTQSQAQQQAQTATSNSGGNTQNTHFVSRESAAALAQGALVLGECGFAGNAGGSGRGGAGFLGLAWQTPQCNDFKLAGYYFTIGDYATGCAIIAETPAGKRQAKRGIVLPQCKNPEPVAPTPVPTEFTLKVEDACEARVDKAFKQCVSK